MPAPVKVIKSKLITYIFQKYLNEKDIQIFKNNFLYYIIFRIIRNFLSKDIILNIYNFKVSGSIKKNKTSYYLLKKCEFGDFEELNLIKKISRENNIIFLDCGCNYGFYSLFTASLSEKNIVISVEASRKTYEELKKNLNLNKLPNINPINKAISNFDNQSILLNESKNDWESSQTHRNFELLSTSNVQSIKIDTILKSYFNSNCLTIIKLDIEGNEMKAINGAEKFIQNASPLIIIEFSKYIFACEDNLNYLENFLLNYNYAIYDTNNNKVKLKYILDKINNLKKGQKTIGNYYLIKDTSKKFIQFLKDE